MFLLFIGSFSFLSSVSCHPHQRLSCVSVVRCLDFWDIISVSFIKDVQCILFVCSTAVYIAVCDLRSLQLGPIKRHLSVFMSSYLASNLNHSQTLTVPAD